MRDAIHRGEVSSYDHFVIGLHRDSTDEPIGTCHRIERLIDCPCLGQRILAVGEIGLKG
jgi:hypothetical protein